MRVTCPFHLILTDMITVTILGEAYKLLVHFAVSCVVILSLYHQTLCRNSYACLGSRVLATSIEQSHSPETDIRSGAQKNSSLLWNLKIHYRVHYSQLPDHSLSHLNPVHTPDILCL